MINYPESLSPATRARLEATDRAAAAAASGDFTALDALREASAQRAAKLPDELQGYADATKNKLPNNPEAQAVIQKMAKDAIKLLEDFR